MLVVIMLIRLNYLLCLVIYIRCLILPYLSATLGILYMLQTLSNLTMVLNIRFMLFYIIRSLAGSDVVWISHCGIQ